MLNHPEINKVPLCVFFICVLISCTSRDKTKQIQQPNDFHSVQISIDPEKSISDDKRVFSKDVFDSVKYTFLETIPESIFGIVSQMEITAKYLIILDKTTHAILIFTKDGKYHSKIKNIATSFFTINNYSDEIIFPDFSAINTSLIYDFDGKFKRKWHTTFDFRNFSVLDTSQFIYYRSFARNKFDDSFLKKHLEPFANLISVKDNNQYNGFLPYDTLSISGDEVRNGQKSFYRNGSSVYFIRPYDYTAYKVEKNSVKPAFKFIFPDRISLPDDFLNNSSYLNRRIAYLDANPEKVYLLSDFYPVGKDLVFTFFSGGLISADIYLYYIKSKHLLPFSKIISDKSTYYLPYGQSVAAVDNNILYNVTSSNMLMKQVWERKETQSLNLPESLKHFFDKGTNRDNPVIIQLYLKQN